MPWSSFYRRFIGARRLLALNIWVLTILWRLQKHFYGLWSVFYVEKFLQKERLTTLLLMLPLLLLWKSRTVCLYDKSIIVLRTDIFWTWAFNLFFLLLFHFFLKILRNDNWADRLSFNHAKITLLVSFRTFASTMKFLFNRNFEFFIGVCLCSRHLCIRCYLYLMTLYCFLLLPLFFLCLHFLLECS